jgi:hypothetical protein
MNKNKYKKQLKKFYKSWQGMYYKLRNSAKYIRTRYFNISKKQFKEWYFKQRQKCYYCKRTLKAIRKHDKKFNIPVKKLTFDRKNNKRGYTIDNIVLCCCLCNFVKRNFFTEKEMLKIGKFLKKYIFK